MISFFLPIVHSRYFTIDFAMKANQKIEITQNVILLCYFILMIGLFFLLINTDYLYVLIFVLPLIIFIISYFVIIYYRKIRKKMPDWIYKIDNNQGVLLNENDISIIKNEKNIMIIRVCT
ncbi:MAG: hypothetical protein PF481_09880 [Bacteroidales bacterium]|jgi:predicted neutral ceramidase superfamily lipid hydrolase|nr:hypothetical protein [Bacteroidales bacterium]